MSEHNDKLYYPGTDEPILLGDRISLRHWFRRKEATVVYVPGQSPRNRHLESKDGSFSHWCYRFDTERKPGEIRMVGYFPSDGYVPRSLRLIRRAKPGDASEFVGEDDEYC